MKKIIIGLVILVLAITAISIGLIHSQNQAQTPPSSVLPKDIGKLEYKFNKDEVVVYKMREDITASSEHELYKNLGGHAIQEWYFIIKTEDVRDESYKFKIVGFSDTAGQLAKYDFVMTKSGVLTPLYPEYWLYLNQPRFQAEFKAEWESDVVMVFRPDALESPSLNLKVKYKFKGIERISNIDCLIIESEVNAKDYINMNGVKDLIEINNKANTYFDYKEGKVIKMDVDRHFKVTMFGEADGKEISIVMRDEKAVTKYELSDRKFTQGQLDAWLYSKFPDIPDEE